jgi:hypothetical protein
MRTRRSVSVMPSSSAFVSGAVPKRSSFSAAVACSATLRPRSVIAASVVLRSLSWDCRYT